MLARITVWSRRPGIRWQSSRGRPVGVPRRLLPRRRGGARPHHGDAAERAAGVVVLCLVAQRSPTSVTCSRCARRRSSTTGRARFRHAATVVAAGFGAFFSASAAGGFKVDYWALRHAGASRRDALTRVLGLGTLEYAVLAPAAMSPRSRCSPTRATMPALDDLAWLAVVPAPPSRPGSPSLTEPTAGAISRHHGRLRRAVAHSVAGLSILRRLLVQPARARHGIVGASMTGSARSSACGRAMAFNAQVRSRC